MKCFRIICRNKTTKITSPPRYVRAESKEEAAAEIRSRIVKPWDIASITSISEADFVKYTSRR